MGSKIKIHRQPYEFVEDGLIVVVPKAILDRCYRQLCNDTIMTVIIHWHGLAPEDATRELIHHFQQQFPNLKL